MDALALSDRCLREGAPDHLLTLLIECGEENNSISGQPQGYGVHNVWSNTWQYCLRLKDKQMAARLALKYVVLHTVAYHCCNVLLLCLLSRISLIYILCLFHCPVDSLVGSAIVLYLKINSHSVL